LRIDEVSVTEIPAQPGVDLLVSAALLNPAEFGDTINTSLTIGTNSGYGTLMISSITSSDADFSATVSSSFTGEYYIGESPNFGELVLVREDSVIMFDWGDGSPDHLT
jgi:hypothetical protein